MNDAVIFLQEKLSYVFSNPQLCRQALTHRSYGSHHNERLEFLGDAILDFIVTEIIYRKHPSATEGELSNMRAHIVRGEQLARIGDALCIGELLLLGAGEQQAGGRQRVSLIANAVEAIIAAIYLDGGLQVCSEVVQQLFAPILETLTPTVGKDAKTTLQEYLQSKHLSLPVYELVDRSGSDHNATFTMACTVSALDKKETGVASSRKQAEQLAAKKVLAHLGL